MKTGIYGLLRPALFALDPEVAHSLILKFISLLGRCHPLNEYTKDYYAGSMPLKPTTAMGLYFPNPIGLAAGLDKDAQAVDGLATLGFGFLELGTVTPKPQFGNPRPRLFRVHDADALINRMGFNSKGLNCFLDNLSKSQQQVKIGINIGRNASTPNEDAWRDYITCLRAVYAIADYVTVNISSPNTAQLRELQFRKNLESLLTVIKKEHDCLHKLHGVYTPIAIKISPDLDDQSLKEISELLLGHGIDGVVATNTTITRPFSKKFHGASEEGGLSGAPLEHLSQEIIYKLRVNTQDKITIIGVGGISDTTSAQAKFKAGADLIQIYTSLIYRGPRVIREITESLKKT